MCVNLRSDSLFDRGLFYDYPGYTKHIDFLVFKTDYVSRPKYWKKGQKLLILDGKDLSNIGEENNIGTHCVKVITTTIQRSYVKD